VLELFKIFFANHVEQLRRYWIRDRLVFELPEEIGIIEMIKREQADKMALRFLGTVDFNAVASFSDKCQALFDDQSLQLIEIMADGWHRNAQLMSKREQLDGLIMLKQPAQNKNLAFLPRIFEGIGLIKRLLETSQCIVICFNSNAKPGGFVKNDAVCSKQRFNIGKLAVNRPRARSDDRCDVGCCNFMLLIKQQLNYSTLPC
jgi:hypothetical protein